MTATPTEFVLRSLDAIWDYGRWTALPEDGHRYEVIDGTLYRTTAPSSFHGWIIGRLWRFVGIPIEDAGVAFPYSAPIGVLMPGCDPVQPDFLLVRRERAAIIRDGRIYGPPDLIVEILSPSNPEHDTETKRRTYARRGARVLDHPARDQRSAPLLATRTGRGRLCPGPHHPCGRHLPVTDAAAAGRLHRSLRRCARPDPLSVR